MKTLAAIVVLAATVDAMPAVTSEMATRACDAMDDFFEAGENLLQEIVTYPEPLIPPGSVVHEQLADLQDIAVVAMSRTWEAQWKSIQSWFPTLRALSSYRPIEMSRKGSERTLALFLTPHPERYNTVKRTIDEVAREGRWIPGEYKANCPQPVKAETGT